MNSYLVHVRRVAGFLAISDRAGARMAKVLSLISGGSVLSTCSLKEEVERTSDLEFTAVMAVIEQDVSVIARIRDIVQSLGLSLSVTRSADEAIAYMRGLGVYGNRTRYPLPKLILLDTGNQGFSDLTLLSWIREDSRFNHIPVGLLATIAPHKMSVSCAIDSSCFIVQRSSLEELSAVLWETFRPHLPSNPQVLERPR